MCQGLLLGAVELSGQSNQLRRRNKLLSRTIWSESPKQPIKTFEVIRYDLRLGSSKRVWLQLVLREEESFKDPYIRKLALWLE